MTDDDEREGQPAGERERSSRSSEREEREGRKERVLHTRVPVVLEDELKRLATNLKMPVSNVVRAILEDALEAVEVVGERAEDEIKGFVTKLSTQREAIRRGAMRAGRTAGRSRDEEPSDAPREATPDEEATATGGERAEAAAAEPSCPTSDASLEGVVGFQRLTLRADASCSVCGRALPRGTEGCRGVRDDEGPRVLLGPRCDLLPVVD